MLHLALDHPPETQNPVYIEEHDSITGLETDVERPTIVAIDDPRVAPDQPLYPLAPLSVRRGLPPRAPVEGIEMDEREAGACRETAGEGRLSRPAAADDENALQVTMNDRDAIYGSSPLGPYIWGTFDPIGRR